MGRTRIKICGVTTAETARAAADSGADAIGLVFHKPSPRYVDPETAWDIVAEIPVFLASVALFVDATVDRFSAVEEVCPTDWSQFHGDEDEETVRRCGPRIIKAVRFDAATIESQLDRWNAVDEVEAILVDGSPGGQGTAFDWPALGGLVRSRKERGVQDKPLILAGGLDPGNVAEAVRAVRPWAVDVSSGVERAPGNKDPRLIDAFCEAVRAAEP